MIKTRLPRRAIAGALTGENAAPLLRSMPRFIDLSIPITNDVLSDPEVMRPKIQYMTHDSMWG